MPRRSLTPSGPSEDSLLAELRALYAETDALHATTTCPASTECCRFGVTGREPYLTSIELLAIEHAVAAAGGPLSRKRRALPLAGNTTQTERTCPLLSENAYSGRSGRSFRRDPGARSSGRGRRRSEATGLGLASGRSDE